MMNQYKRFLSCILVLVMLFSVLTGVVSANEGVEINEASKAIQTSVDNEGIWLKNHVVIAEYTSLNRSMKYSTWNGYTISAPDREYTVKNVGGPQDCYLYVYFIKYTPMTGETLREEYGSKVADKNSLELFPEGDVPVYLTKGIIENKDKFYLTKDYTWIAGMRVDMDDRLLRIEEDEEVTFTLPDAKEDDIYILHIIAVYPDARFPNNIGLSFFHILIDTDGVYPTGIVNPRENISAPVMDRLERKTVDKLQATGANYGGAKRLDVFSLGDPVHAAPGQTFTVINTGKNRNHTVSVRVKKYTLIEARQLRAWYRENEIMQFPGEELPRDATEVYYCFADDKNVYYLTDEGVLNSGFDDYSDSGVLKLKAGESATFTLPDATDGILYEVSFRSADYTISYYVMMDETAQVVNSEIAPEQEKSITFTDVPDDAYFAVAVDWAVHRKITTGTTETTFSPDDTCTTAQILTFLWRANGQPVSAIENPFVDVSENNYYYQAALWAAKNGLVEGDVFNGSLPCTRASVVTYLWKLSGKERANPCTFVDVDSDAEYAQAVAWAVRESITNGTSETEFSPEAICTRAQIVTLLYRALVD